MISILSLSVDDMDSQFILALIRTGDIESVRRALDENPWLVHIRNSDRDVWDEISTLHCAAKHGHLDIVKLLVDKGVEVYSNPLATYPPVIIAAWNKRQPVVDYFL